MDTDSFTECVGQILKCDDMKKVVRILFDSVKSFISMDFLTIVLYDAESHTAHDRIHATDQDVLFVDDTITFSKDTADIARHLISSTSGTYITDSMANPLIREFNAHVGIIETASVIMLPGKLESGVHVIFNMVLWDTDRYTPRDLSDIQKISDQIGFILQHIYSNIAGSKKHIATKNRETRNRMTKLIVGKDGGMKDTMIFADMVAKLDTPVLLIGESGVGKDVIATNIHYHSGRKNQRLVCVNCGAISESLLDSELFGHEKGAFTGATDSKKGYFEQADGGTIFLDEISELSKSAQVKLLRVLQNKTFRRVGGEKSISVDTRVIAASNRDLQKMAFAKKFRNDLWFRLNTFPIQIPPLRRRTQDIAPLVHHFAKLNASKLRLPYKYRFAENAMDQLRQHDWPGNVRELKNTVEYAMIICRGKPISFDFLQIRNNNESAPLQKTPGKKNRYLTMNEMMTKHIRNVLAHTNGRIEGKEGAAEILDMNPSTLRARIKRLNIKIKKLSTR